MTHGTHPVTCTRTVGVVGVPHGAAPAGVGFCVTLTGNVPVVTDAILFCTVVTIGPVFVSTPHVPRFGQVAAMRAPSRAACVIMLTTMNAWPNVMAPSATVTNRTITIPVSIKDWPRLRG